MPGSVSQPHPALARPRGRGTRAIAAALAVSGAITAVGAAAVANGPGPGRFYVTVFYPVREACYDGQPVRVPGLDRPLPQDYVLKWMGLSTQWEGVLADGKRVHLTSDGNLDWLNAAGEETHALPTGKWSNGVPAWRDAGWRNASGVPTYRRAGGSWSNGRGTTFKPITLTLAYGRSDNRLVPWRSAAVDFAFIEKGSKIVIPSYAGAPNRGRFTAEDVGTTVKGEHINIRIPSPACGQPVFGGWLPATVTPPAP